MRKQKFILCSAMLFLFIFSFYPAATTANEATSDSESTYIEQVKSAMKSENPTGTVQGTTGRPQIGYFSYIRMIITLALVVGLIYLVYYLLKKSTSKAGDTGTDSAVVQVQSVGTGKTVQILYIGGKYLVIGVAGDSINYLSEITDPKEIERLEILYNDRKAKMGDNFFDLFQNIFQRTVHKNTEEKTFNYEEDTLDFIKKQKDRLSNSKKDDEP